MNSVEVSSHCCLQRASWPCRFSCVALVSLSFGHRANLVLWLPQLPIWWHISVVLTPDSASVLTIRMPMQNDSSSVPPKTGIWKCLRRWFKARTYWSVQRFGEHSYLAFPFLLWQGPSTIFSLLKCSWCHEQSAWWIMKWFTTQKAKTDQSARVFATFPPLPVMSKQLSRLCHLQWEEHFTSFMKMYSKSIQALWNASFWL